MKLEIDSLSVTLSQERCQLATVEQEKFNLETISLDQGKQLDIALSKLKDLEQQHSILAVELETLRDESTETINRLRTDLEASNRLLKAKSTEVNNLEEQFSSVSQTLSRLRKIDNIEGLQEAMEIGRGSYGAVYEVRVNSVPCIAKRVHDILVGRGREEQVGDEESMAIVHRFHEALV